MALLFLQATLLAFSWSTSTQVNAQQTMAKCTLSNYTWADNSLGQDPCAMSSYARGFCVGGPFTVPPLEPQKVYIPNPPNECECSEVVYSLVSACSACQNQTQFYTWQAWTLNCTTQYAGYPLGVPSGTAFPAWAYLDVSKNNTFDPIAARNDANAPESTATYTATSKTFVTGGGSSSASATSTFTPICGDCGSGGGGGSGGGNSTGGGNNGGSDNSSGGSSGLSPGALAGVIVGPIVGVALITAIVIFACLSQRKHNAANANAYSTNTNYNGAPQMGQYDGAGAASPTSAQAMLPQQQNGSFSGPYNSYGTGPTNSYPNGSGQSYPSGNGHNAFRPYDPNDPSTFPGATPATSIHTTPANPNVAGGFRGIAEI